MLGPWKLYVYSFENIQGTYHKIVRFCGNNYSYYCEEHLLALFSELLSSVAVNLHIISSIIILKYELMSLSTSRSRTSYALKIEHVFLFMLCNSSLIHLIFSLLERRVELLLSSILYLRVRLAQLHFFFYYILSSSQVQINHELSFPSIRSLQLIFILFLKY